MKTTALTLLVLLTATVSARAQQLIELCRPDDVAAVISEIKRPCKFKQDRKTASESDLDGKKDVHRKLLAGQQLQCSPDSTKKDEKDQKPSNCVAIYLCGSRQYASVADVSPNWFTVVNVPNALPRGDTRPGSTASVGPTNFVPPYTTPNGASPTAVGYMYRPENPQTAGTVTASISNDVEKDLAAANQARDSGMLPIAMNRYQRVVERNPTEVRAIVGIANVYSDQGRWEDAAEHYRKALQLNPSLTSAYAPLSYVLLQSSRSNNKLQLLNAEAAARHAVRSKPVNAVAHDLLGVTLEMQGHNLEQAEAAYKKAVELEPDFGIAHLHLSSLLWRLGKTAEAEQHFVKGVLLATDPQTLMLIAAKLQDHNLFNLSEGPLLRVLAAQPANAEALHLLARALVYREQYSQAVPLLDRIPTVGKITFEGQRLLGFAYLKMEQPDQAQKAFLSAAEVASQDQRKLLAGETGFSGVAELYAKLGRRDEALRAYGMVLSLDPDKPKDKYQIANRP